MSDIDNLTTVEPGYRVAPALSRLADDLPLFSAAAAKVQAGQASAEPSAVEERLAAIQPDDLTPRDALEVLYELRQLLRE